MNIKNLKSYSEVIKTVCILIIAVCSIILVIQGFGIGTQDVYVRGGYVDADITGGHVNVFGSVDVGNTVDVNLDKVLGHPVGCHSSYTIEGKDYVSMDVTIR